MERTWEMGELRVTVDAPDGIGTPSFAIWPDTADEFRAWIDKLGGVEHFEGSSANLVFGRAEDRDILVVLHAPRQDAPPPQHPVIEEFEQRKAELAAR